MNFNIKKRQIVLFLVVFSLLLNLTSAVELRWYTPSGAEYFVTSCTDTRTSANDGVDLTCADSPSMDCSEEGDYTVVFDLTEEGTSSLDCTGNADPYTCSTTSAGYGTLKIKTYNIDYDSDSIDCECYTDTGYFVSGGESSGFGEYSIGTETECCEDDSGEFYITDGAGAPGCCDDGDDCIDDNGICREEYPAEATCGDSIDNDCDSLIDCEDLDCGGTLEGYVYDEEGNTIPDALVEVYANTTKIDETFTDGFGAYSILVPCGTFNVVASYEDYVPDTIIDIVVPTGDIVAVDNLILEVGRICEMDCTYNTDNLCHSECDGVSGCNFEDDTAKLKCNFAEKGWEVEYDSDNIIECCEGSPISIDIAKKKAEVSCSYGNIVKYYKIIYYNGKPVRMVTVVCGE